jgi:hypothetical protein
MRKAKPRRGDLFDTYRHGAHCGEGPVLAMLAVLRVAPLLPSPTLRAVPG